MKLMELLFLLILFYKTQKKRRENDEFISCQRFNRARNKQKKFSYNRASFSNISHIWKQIFPLRRFLFKLKPFLSEKFDTLPIHLVLKTVTENRSKLIISREREI